MRLDNLAHIAKVQWYATANYPCSYLPDLTARSQVALVHPQQADTAYSNLIAQGFRRSGGYVYRPHCDHCSACVAVRIPVEGFAPSRSQRRAARVLSALTIQAMPLKLHPEHLALYVRYQQTRHAEDGLGLKQTADTSAGTTQQSYSQFLLRSHVRSQLIELRDAQGRLHAVSVLDTVADGLSAVYTFFDPDLKGAQGSLGTACVLWMVQQAQHLGLPYVYLGYLIAQSPKMAYKANFQPLEVLFGGQWLSYDAYLNVR